ncbi:hypothetical protein HDU83_005988 [Entophlyctis luteolus]|nr:hypothetical protein HDU83_005988 [Entophlyctis luteolus]KAJ3380790.1 hypothetical protein HDU84_005573 [Entophlyctis sp. JEL0112]
MGRARDGESLDAIPSDSVNMIDIQASASVVVDDSGASPTVLFSLAYDPSSASAIVVGSSIIFPLAIPVDADDVLIHNSTLLLTATVQKITESEGDKTALEIKSFDSPNLFEGLRDDPHFNPKSLPVHRFPFEFKRPTAGSSASIPKFLQKSVRLLSPLRITPKIVHLNPSRSILAASIYNTLHDNEEKLINVLSVTANIPGVVLKPIVENYPLAMSAGDESRVLFDIFAMEDAEDAPSCEITFVVKWTTESEGLCGQVVVSKFHPDLPDSAIVLNRNVKEITSSPTLKGLDIAFRVLSPVLLRTVFTIEMTIVNKSSHSRNLNVSVPQKWAMKHEKKPIDAKVGTFTNLHMPAQEFVDRLLEAESQEAALICLENDLELGIITSNSCKSVHLHFIALRGNLHTIEALDIVDKSSGDRIELRKFMQVYAS